MFEEELWRILHSAALFFFPQYVFRSDTKIAKNFVNYSIKNIKEYVSVLHLFSVP